MTEAATSSASPAAPATPGARPRRLAILIACAIPIGLSAVWTASSADQVAQLRQRFDDVTLVVLALAVTGTCFALGLAGLAATCVPAVGRAADGSHRGSRWRAARAQLPLLVDDLASNPWFYRSWILNSIGTLGPCIVLVIAVLALLPAPAWGLALLPAIDLVISAAARLPIHLAILRRRASVRDGALAPVVPRSS